MSPQMVTPKHHLPVSETDSHFIVQLADPYLEVMLGDIESKERPGIFFDIVAVEPSSSSGAPKFMPTNIRYPKSDFTIQDIFGLEDKLMEKKKFCPRCKSLDEALHMLYDARRMRDGIQQESVKAQNREIAFDKNIEFSKHSPPDVKVESDFKNFQPNDMPSDIMIKFNSGIEHAMNKFQSDMAEFASQVNDRILNPFRFK